MMLMQVIEARVSVTRLQNYFNLPELTDSEKTTGEAGTVKIENGNFTWKKSEGASLEDISIDIKQGELVGIVGHIGSGKSSLISAMLSEMDHLSGSVSLSGTVAYVPQDAWLQNATLKDNIIFGKKLDEVFYKKCVNSASLRDDLEILQGGDQTEIGEKGINLSGGQKQRVSLARAAYANPDIILFDDPLSAVDPHVGKEIFTNLIGRDSMLKGKTRVLATHATQFLPMCDRVVLLSKGKILDVGKYEDIWARNPTFHAILKADASAAEKTAEEPAEKKSKVSIKESKTSQDGKITEKEDCRRTSREEVQGVDKGVENKPRWKDNRERRNKDGHDRLFRSSKILGELRNVAVCVRHGYEHSQIRVLAWRESLARRLVRQHE